jgi:hypothetical protein
MATLLFCSQVIPISDMTAKDIRRPGAGDVFTYLHAHEFLSLGPFLRLSAL